MSNWRKAETAKPDYFFCYFQQNTGDLENMKMKVLE